ncbi:RIO1 family-domain-containing protein [Armillaria luteobubalina]|uniref:Serine/threonine-protein kinase RIO2 n=1 Tax=Armillaria luteobubalina TaxID=153913 RepID=A0AA39QNC6_9AGAR|nr:RIO1 family-domain-containing protein [Armillaria luteobubalina]
MKLDATDLRYVTPEEFRVLTAVEMGSKNHEVVPTNLIAQISGLRGGGVNKLIGSLAKRNLVSKVQNSKYDGYRLTYGGYDYLAMRAMSKRDSMHSVGNQIGVGKESDIYIVADSEGKEMVLKLHRLGRISFRAIKDKRDYLGKRKSASWMYMSRLAAQKEWAFMQVLHEHDFPVPRPIDQARHCILMEFIDAYPLRQISEVESPGKLYSTLMDIIVRFARAGLIHGDFNEFNILIRRDTGEPVVIDFPQMVSTSHVNAEWYFNRDVECIRTFFRRRFQYESSLYPRFKTIATEDSSESTFRLDVVVAASGFGNKDMKVLEEYMAAVNEEEGQDEEEEEEEEDDEDEDEGDNEGEEGLGEEKAGYREDEGQDQKDEIEAKEDVTRTSLKNMPTDVDEHQDRDVAMDDEPHQAKSRGRTEDYPSDVSDISETRALSRSPPRSRSVSPDSLAKMTEALSLNNVRNIVSSNLSKSRAQQQRKYHSKRGSRKAGRPQGSKAKQDTRVKMDGSGVWD